MNGNRILEGFIHELAVVVGALSASDTTVAEATPQSTGQWTAAVTFVGAGNGICTVALDEAGVLAVTRALIGSDDVPDEAIAGTVQELLTQAASALQNGSDIRDLTVEVGTAAFYEGLALPEEAFTRAISSPLVSVPLVVSIDGTLTAPVPVAEPPQEVAEPKAAAKSSEPGVSERIDVILDIDLPLVVRFGRTDMALRALTRLSPGSVIELHRSPDDPVELLVSDRVIARGEVVIVGGNYGVRILDVVSPSERMRSMEVRA
jgi:flagellar motor switch protein FliN/FliY